MKNGEIQKGDGQSRRPDFSHGNGDGISREDRLRKLEIQMARIDKRIKSIEKNMATKAWVLGGVIGGMILSMTLGIAIANLFSN